MVLGESCGVELERCVRVYKPIRRSNDIIYRDPCIIRCTDHIICRNAERFLCRDSIICDSDEIICRHDEIICRHDEII